MSLPDDTTAGAALALAVLALVRVIFWLVSFKRPSEVETIREDLREIETSLRRLEQTALRTERDVLAMKSKA